MRRSASLLAVVLLGVVPTTAAGAVRYAVPSGGASAGNCLGTPCTLPFAVSAASGGDQVLLASGDYSLTSTLAVMQGVSIEGPAGQARAKLVYSGVPTQPALSILASNVAVRRLDIVGAANLGTRLVTVAGGLSGVLMDELDVTDNGQGGALVGSDVDLRNSRLVSMTTGAVAATITGTVTGCTIIADQGSGARALWTTTSFDPTATVVVRNSILQGGFNDAEAAGATASIDIDYSSYSLGQIALNTGGSAAPGTFNVDAAGTTLVAPLGGANIRQGAGSNTIDAGTSSAPGVGTFDFEGDPRAIGSAPDIGADEYVPAPTATTTAATAVTQTTATLNASINPNGRAVSYFFDFGTTASYGSTTTNGSVGGFTTPQPGIAMLTGLQPGTTYHFRVTATRAPDSVQGGDVTFTTLAAPTPPAPPPPPPADKTAPSVTGLSLTPASVAAGKSASLALRASEAATIKVTVDRLVPGRRRGAKCLTTARTGKRCTKAVRSGSVSGSATANVKTTVTVPTRLIRKKGTYRITVVVTDSAGNAAKAQVKTLRVR